MKGVIGVKAASSDFQTAIWSHVKIQETHVQDTFKKLQSAEGSQIYSAD
jgi:hypothetical protein